MTTSPQTTQVQWTVTAYGLSFAVLLMNGAALGDRFGRRRVFTIGLGLFASASAGCALSPDVGWLITARAVQGAGAALVMPLAVALLSANTPPERRGRALGIFEGLTGLATIAGPPVGGAVAQLIGWEWMFWVNVPIGLLMIPLVISRAPLAGALADRFGNRPVLVGGLALQAAGLAWIAMIAVPDVGYPALVRPWSCRWSSAGSAPRWPSRWSRTRCWAPSRRTRWARRPGLTT